MRREKELYKGEKVGSLGCIMKKDGKHGSKKKMALLDVIIVPTITYASITWVYDERIQVKEMSYLT